ncbi:hypothetical protein GQ55_2G289400 [Panicum hallii var. hallii]|uniref:C2H2-type domain-containing protein n=1 Tax=Panicum hallii var. hallii TaxID=1504633 RepID=A0A2T7ETH6_9POAL|nr:hypothetical protein GQ55_2G289400 [Panicum hallii var. hallii]
MGTEVAAVVDLGVLSQSDLVALAAASPYAVDPRRGRRRDGDFLPPPKIDRAVFNESAGSRKQTFSRHRPATNISHNLTPATAAASSPAAAPVSPAEEDSENRLIVFHLRRLFARDDPSYPVPSAIPPRQETLRPPGPLRLPPAAAVTDPDREVLNPKGVAVDLARLAGLVDPYGEELRQRTAGLGSESELLGFMNALEGQWGSRRRRRKFVDAGMFADHLPRGWKLLLGLKRKERMAWINCRRYVSPKGHQFATCKEVSSYLMSLLGHSEAKPTATRTNSAGVHDLDVNSAGLHQQTIAIEQRQLAVPVPSVTLFSHSGGSHLQNLQKVEAQIEVNPKECRKCNLTFHDQGAYMQHQLSFHQRKAKRRKVSKSSELGTNIDGNYETQQKTSGEVPGNFSHGVADVKYQGQSRAKLNDGTDSGQLGVQSSLKPVPFRFQELTMLPQQEKEPSAGEPVSMNHKGPRKEMTGFPEQEKGTAAGEPIPGHRKDPKETTGFPEQEKVPAAGETIAEHHMDSLKETSSAAELEKGPSAGEPASGHHRDVVDNSDDHRTHDGTCDNAVASLFVHAESKLSTCNSTNVHENDCSKDLELSNTDYPQKFNRSDETYGVHKEVSPTVADPVESKSTNDLMGCTDITPAEQVSQPYDLRHGKFGSSPEGNDFHKQLESNPHPATRDETDLNSIGMEVDGGNITSNVDNPTSFKSEEPLDNRIMDCEMTSLKDDEIKNGVRIRDVNLNSCSDTISSPVSGGNYETSNAPDDAVRSSIIAQCFGTNSNEENAGKGENFVNQKNDMVYQSNLTMGSTPAAQINVDCFTSSCSMTPEIKNYGSRGENDAKEALVNSQNMTSNETGFDVEAYNSDIFNSTITESSLAQLNNAINMKNDFASCYSLSDLNTLTGGNATDEIDIHGMRSSFVSSTSRTDQNEHCTLDFDIKGSMLEALEKSDSDLENQYNGAGPSCDSLPAAGTSGNIDEFMSMQTNFGSFTSLVRAVEDVPLSRILQDQCDLQLGFGGPKQPTYPSFEQQLRMASAGAPPYGNMGRHDAVPVPEPTLMLGYAPPLGSCPSPFQLGWGPSYSKMVGVLQSVCVWCNSQFQHFGTVAEQQADSLGYICPSCKGKFSGHLGINGPSI